jgi:hypothetical protein
VGSTRIYEDGIISSTIGVKCYSSSLRYERGLNSFKDKGLELRGWLDEEGLGLEGVPCAGCNLFEIEGDPCFVTFLFFFGCCHCSLGSVAVFYGVIFG